MLLKYEESVMLIKILSLFENFNNILFGVFDNWINNTGLPDFAADAICDSVHLIPFLFIIFVLIEIFENYFSSKINFLSKSSKYFGPLIGAVVAGIPQCGFSVIATPLYINRMISRGTLIAIYISTSDEALPILISTPSQFSTILPLLSVKICLGITAGYLVDLFSQQKNADAVSVENICNDETGCCSHHIHASHRKRELFFHPLKHTFSIFIMILLISLLLNFCFNSVGSDLLNKILLNKSVFQPIIAAIIGLIPNCAISVLLTMLYINGILSFASVVAGLSSGAGLGLIVLLKRNKSIKDSMIVIGCLLGISVLAGIILSIAGY